MKELKCTMCDQFLAVRLMKGDPRNKDRPPVCINPKCPDYFEPAAAPLTPAKPRHVCEHCLGIMGREPNVEGAEWYCLDPQCPKSEPRPLSAKDQLMASILERSFRTDGGATPLEIPPTEPARGHGIKLDDGKPLVYTEFLRQFPRAIRLVARVGERGSAAPGHVRSGWKTVEHGYERYSDALARHALQEAMMASDPNPASAYPAQDLIWEAATVAWNALARLEHLIRDNPTATERIDGDPFV